MFSFLVLRDTVNVYRIAGTLRFRDVQVHRARDLRASVTIMLLLIAMRRMLLRQTATFVHASRCRRFAFRGSLDQQSFLHGQIDAARGDL